MNTNLFENPSRKILSKAMKKAGDEEFFKIFPHLYEVYNGSGDLSLGDILAITDMLYGGKVSTLMTCLDPEKAVKVKVWSDDAKEFSGLMAEKLQEWDPSVDWRRLSGTTSWLRCSEKLVAEYEKQHLHDVLAFAVTHSFWGKIIISPSKLLNHFPQLSLQVSRLAKESGVRDISDVSYRAGFNV